MLQGNALTTPAQTDQGAHFSFEDFKIHTIENRLPVKAFGDVHEFDQGLFFHRVILKG